MRTVELFAGAGGLGLGVSRAGFTPAAVVEWDRYCCDTIRENQERNLHPVVHWPLTEGDVRDFDFGSIDGEMDLVSGGPPCQPFSLGGKHRSHHDDRDMFPQKATVANRMSPPGIAMFYGSDEPETALREVARTPECAADRYAVGEFRTLRETRILDLTDIPRIPSIFEPIPDTLEYDPRPPLIFLNYFAAELSMPIAGDRSVHVEYVPPQVVTEFVRTEFRHEGLPLDGIRYRSARHEGGTSLVLFASQDNLAGPKDAGIRSVFTGPDRWIELVGRDEREVAAEDAEAWDREAPRAFEWV